MGSRGLLNIGLLVLLAALITISVFEPGKKQSEPPDPVAPITRERINTIQIERTGEPAITLEQESGQWLIAGDPAIPAAEFKVNALLDLAASTPVREYAADALDPERVGLAQPALSVRFNDDYTVTFGDTDALNGNRYIQSGDRILLVADNTFSIIDTDRAGYTSMRLLPQDSDIIGLQLPGLTMKRNEEGQWRLEPEVAGISTDILTRLVDDWKHASALWVERSDTGKARGDRIQVVLDRQTIELFAEKTDTDLAITRPDYEVIYHLTGNNFERLLPDLSGSANSP